MIFKHPKGATPLSQDELDGLIPSHIWQQSELNRLEQFNISEAYKWAMGKNHKDIVTPLFLKKIHQKMFCHVWRWAGHFRTTEKNIGVHPWRIHIELKNLIDDFNTWKEFKTYPPDEIAARFHHRLVYIHLFPNGNGRHARLFADIIMDKIFKMPHFSWGEKHLETPCEARKRYIAALRQADNHNYIPLLEFVRS
jgi:Fic-DOC domain mobile mystery protein B